VLYDFKGGDGSGPSSDSLILDPKGNLYGTADGTSGAGIVFEATP
jgi:hypothetical protein